MMILTHIDIDINEYFEKCDELYQKYNGIYLNY